MLRAMVVRPPLGCVQGVVRWCCREVCSRGRCARVGQLARSREMQFGVACSEALWGRGGGAVLCAERCRRRWSVGVLWTRCERRVALGIACVEWCCTALALLGCCGAACGCCVALPSELVRVRAPRLADTWTILG